MYCIRLSTTCCLVLPLLLVSLSGCDPEVRREALGGGALTPVKVTLLQEVKDGEGGAKAESSAGPKITEFGTVTGRISVDGALPNLPPLLAQGQATKDLVCSEKPVPNQTVVGTDGGLGNVFVYLRRVPNVDVPAPSEEQLIVDQQGCTFVPHAQVFQVGQPILLKNSDEVAHNVKMNAQANSFAATVPPLNAGNVDYQFQFAEQKPFFTSCDFHGWMSAYMLPVDHPWATVSKLDGTFEIPNVPAGKVEFVIWHEKLDYIERAYKVDVPANGQAEPINITVNASKLSG